MGRDGGHREAGGNTVTECRYPCGASRDTRGLNDAGTMPEQNRVIAIRGYAVAMWRQRVYKPEREYFTPSVSRVAPTPEEMLMDCDNDPSDVGEISSFTYGMPDQPCSLSRCTSPCRVARSAFKNISGATSKLYCMAESLSNAAPRRIRGARIRKT